MNRRNKKARTKKRLGSKLKFFLKTLVFTVTGVSLALFYVWQYVQMSQTGFGIKSREKELIGLQKENQGLELRLSRLLMPPNIRSRIVKLNINLQEPERWQIVRVEEQSILFDGNIMFSGEIAEEGIFGKTLIGVSAVSGSPETIVMEDGQ
ncbi:MAG: hypothetical protein P9M03_02665 [Candidatus Theseobacter exili]|nr:hypothetical protein [Candidatus Theseobacter exili]